jgi:transposase
MSQMTVMSGAERRRKWSSEQKRAIVAAAFSAGSSVSAVARREDVCTGLIYRWRQDLRSGGSPLSFSPVVLISEPAAPLGSSTADGSIVVEMGQSRIRIGAGASATLVTATLKALRS